MERDLAAISDGEVREGQSEELTFGQRLDEQGVSYGKMQEVSMLGRDNCKCKGPEAATI